MEEDVNMYDATDNLDEFENKKMDESLHDYETDDKFNDTRPISQEDSWFVIASFFENHGLVSQQIGSFNQFVNTNIQEIILEYKDITVMPEKKFGTNNTTGEFKYEINFSQLWISKPYFKENDDKYNYIFPNEARVRNLTYEADMLLDVGSTEKTLDEDSEDKKEMKIYPKNFIGKIPIMVKSKYCTLSNKEERNKVEVKECVFDQGGYFIMNGGEKVIVAQERMANNFIYVFKKKEPSKYSWYAEIRSNMDSSNRPPNPFSIKILSKTEKSKKENFGQVIEAKIPYIKEDIPIIIVFRALGFVADKDILDHILFDYTDLSLLELLRPSLEKAMPIQSQEVALDYIGKRGNVEGVEKKLRIKHAREILQREMLPHVSTLSGNEGKKAFFIGYMVYRLCIAALGRTTEDDRDHYGKKRLDMAGSLFAGLFRQLFRKFSKTTQLELTKMVNKQKDMSLINALKGNSITKDLRFALNTGNWGSSKSGQVLKTGVSQVLNRLTFVSSLSHLRRLNTPLQKQGKLTKPRQLHNTHWGMICPAETPEGNFENHNIFRTGLWIG